MKKSIQCLMVLLCLFKGFALDYKQETSIRYNGSDDFQVWCWGSVFLLPIPITWTESHKFSWTVDLTSKDENNKICGYVSDPSTLYAKKGTNINISTSFDGWYDEQIHSYVYFNGVDTGSDSFILNNSTKIEYLLKGPKSDHPYSQLAVNIIPDDDIPYIEINNKDLNTYYRDESTNIFYLNKDYGTINYNIKDDTSGIVVCNRIVNQTTPSFNFGGIEFGGFTIPYPIGFPTSGVLLGDDTYKLTVDDLVGHKIERTIVVDTTAPEIKAFTDVENQNEYTGSNWINKDLFITYEDACSGIKTKVGQDFYNTSGSRDLSATDKALNTKTRTIKIDKDLPKFEPRLMYDSVYDTDLKKIKSCFTLNIHNISDEHSGIAAISVKTIVNNENPKGTEIVTIPENEKGKNSIKDKTYTYELTERDKDNNISFVVTVTDVAGNIENVTLGGENGYFVPASIYTSYNEVEKNRVKINFYRGNTNTALEKGKYRSIKLKRHFSLTNKDNQNVSNEITETNFGTTKDSLFNTSVKQNWQNLTTETEILSDIKNNSDCYYVDNAIKDTGFTHKNISYDCIYEYTNPVGDEHNPIITETICNDTKLALSNNKGRFSIRVKGEEGSYLVIDDSGTIREGSTESFKMPETGVVGIEVKVEDSDLEPYQIQLQGYVELTSENGKFKLQETDTIPIGTDGVIAGCGESILRNDNKNIFISRNKTMDGNWVELGNYALQYNITTVFDVELTEGFIGNQEEWSEKSVRLYAQSPSVLGGKARLMVGDAGSYNADGITARPWQPIKMEIVPATENQSLTDLFWDFGNGLTSENCGKYDKKSNTKFENICYEQSPDRTGALSEYKLKIRSGSDEAEFKVNIIDTQWGELLGNEVWRGEHIIKKEIIVPANKTLQIGDTAHSDYDSDITCLCVGKIREEEKGGITVKEGGTLIIDEGNNKTIRFVQAGFKDDKYIESAEKEKSSQNMWKGISVKGQLKGDSLDLRDSDCGLTVYPNGSIEFSDLIKIDSCKNGILMNGTSLKAKKIELSNCSGYGIKLNSKLNCEKFLITNNGRGLILTGNGNFTAEDLEIKGCITGIHLLGGNITIGRGKISGCREYGIKKDTDRTYTYSAFSFEGNERNIYENGIIK